MNPDNVLLALDEKQLPTANPNLFPPTHDICQWFLINQTHSSVFHRSFTGTADGIFQPVMQQVLPGVRTASARAAFVGCVRPAHPGRPEQAERVRQPVPQVDTPESRPNKRGTNGLTRLWHGVTHLHTSSGDLPMKIRKSPFIDYGIDEVNWVCETRFYNNTTDTPRSHYYHT